jgi:hypothetical protein
MPKARPTAVDVKISLPYLFEMTGKWTADETQRLAAWALYVELATRVTTVPLRPEDGLLREAMSSLYSLFGSTRKILRRHGPSVGIPGPESSLSVGYIAVNVLNAGVRPFLAKWHPELARWEQGPHEGVGVAAHERAWEHAATVRKELADLQRSLNQYAKTLEAALGISRSLLEPPPRTDG